MNGMKEGRGFRPLADTATNLLDPVLRKRAGINLSLIQSWEDIVGAGLGQSSRPLRIMWPRRAHENDPFQPATLVVACEGFAAMRMQHETGEVINRVNGFLGFAAIGRIKIEQKPLERKQERRLRKPVDIPPGQARKIEGQTSVIEDDGLRLALERLGRNIAASKLKKNR
ncbi:DUF721 domain-containing protein [Paenochrobactrum sp. BZR 588]|uniref:DUF721 domain-containing protein n=1 Tax=Paenochrobactrum TaxID=999488 RepID=UPI0035BC7C8D